MKNWLKDQRSEFVEYVLDKEKLEDIRRITRIGRPWGSMRFYNKAEKLLDRVLSVKKKGRPHLEYLK